MPTTKILAAAAVMTALLAGAPAASEQDNKTVVLAFYDLVFAKHRPKEAAETFIGDRYIQHNPRVPNGKAAFSGFFEGFFARNPKASSIIKHVLAEGDLVAVHSHAKANDEDRGKAIVDLFRVENGKIVEHWDVMQDIPVTSANGNTMFDGTEAR